MKSALVDQYKALTKRKQELERSLGYCIEPDKPYILKDIDETKAKQKAIWKRICQGER